MKESGSQFYKKYYGNHSVTYLHYIFQFFTPNLCCTILQTRQYVCMYIFNNGVNSHNHCHEKIMHTRTNI